MLKLTSVILFLTIAMDTWHYVLLQDGSSNSPFNQGNNLYETPYSHSVMSMSAGRPMMAMVAGTGTNGMGVPVTSGHVTQMSTSPDKGKQTTDCIATIICMLSCKTGYKLGPKGQDGCQTCSCSKNESKDSNTNPDKPKNGANSGGQSSPSHTDNMPGGSSLMFGSGSGSGTGSLYSNTNFKDSKNDTNSGIQSSPFHIGK
ncbi:uncharacterized protein LOC110453833, partial [Mizuhopecten yessoensis]|uniref:uncharacterized protein LOC110453833 n=1 Tax=Mizuhopecten yessoensis TaxID=6573 RepID=UPI000B45E6C1